MTGLTIYVSQGKKNKATPERGRPAVSGYVQLFPCEDHHNCLGIKTGYGENHFSSVPFDFFFFSTRSHDLKLQL